jgi:hypothetical protein
VCESDTGHVEAAAASIAARAPVRGAASATNRQLHAPKPGTHRTKEIIAVSVSAVNADSLGRGELSGDATPAPGRAAADERLEGLGARRGCVLLLEGDTGAQSSHAESSVSALGTT